MEMQCTGCNGFQPGYWTWDGQECLRCTKPALKKIHTSMPHSWSRLLSLL